VGCDEEGAEGARQEGHAVDDPDTEPAEGRLEHLAEDPQDVHVEGDVQEVLVQEPAGHQSPPLAVGHAQRGHAGKASKEGPFFVDLAGGTAAEAEVALGEKDGDVDRDQRDRDLGAPGRVAQGLHDVFWREHSGQRMPTGVVVIQSGQMGRPQLAQETPVSRLGWR